MSIPSLAEVSSVTPLNALNAVVLDTETTGLDTSVARLIQVGAVRLNKGKVLYDQVFDSLINPGVPIPPVTSNIHGLYDTDVADAPAFKEIRGQLESWIGNSILIGYSVGYDLTILKRENKLLQLEWHPPRSIDVRHMIKILSPQLPDYSLDTIASWLGINSDKRHQALGDAIITAEVFLALVPRLMEKGIRTLAELEVMCRIANDGATSESQAGWHDFLYSKRKEDISQHALAKVDSYPYRHRVRDVMSSPPEIVESDTPLSQSLSCLIEKKISCVFVKEGDSKSAYGIITERDILRAINGNCATVLAQPTRQYANFPLKVVPEDAFIYRAMGRMSRNNFRHLGVVDKKGNLVGALTSRDLLKQRAEDALSLGDAIEHAETEEDLSVAWANLALVARALDIEDVDARDIAAVISRELCALTSRACQIAEQEMVDQGLGGPPVPYVMLVLGSGGRGESLLAMDQDNAIIYREGEPDSAEDDWFAKLGARVADLLNSSGVPYCKGGIMGKNPEWRMSVARWKQQIQVWVNRTSPEDLLKTDIFFDAVAVHGDFELMENVIKYAMNVGSNSREFLHLMATNAASVNSPLRMFGRYRLDKGRVDIKLSGIMPIFSAARVAAIRHQVMENATPDRLRAVQAATTGPVHFFNNLIEAHRIILTAILKQQLYDLDNGIPLSNKVAPDMMNQTSRNNLRWAMEQVQSVTDLLGVPV